MKKVFLWLGMIAVAMVPQAGAGWGFCYQATVRNIDGTLLKDAAGYIVYNHTVEIRLYATVAATEALWARSYAVTCDDTGLFNVLVADDKGNKIGSLPGTGLESVLRKCSPSGVYIGLTVSGGTEILPRERICVVPYASVATSALSLTGGVSAAGTDMTVSGTATAGRFACTTFKVKEGSATFDLGLVPVYGIVMWNGDNAPDGKPWDSSTGVSQDGHWAICKGQKDVCDLDIPDLSGRFVFGASSATWNTSGGGETVTLEGKHIPAHTHRFAATVFMGSNWEKIIHGYGSFAEDYKVDSVGTGNDSHRELARVKWGNEPGLWVIDYPRMMEDGGNSGMDGESHYNLPPYFALYYIMRLPFQD